MDKNGIRQKRNMMKKTPYPMRERGSYGAGGRTRTGTLSPAVDFESTTSANSITPAHHYLLYLYRALLSIRKLPRILRQG